MTPLRGNPQKMVWVLTGLLLSAAALGLARVAAAEEPAKLRVLVVAGGHGFPVEPFRAVFKPFDEMAVTFSSTKVTARRWRRSTTGPTRPWCSTTTRRN